MKSWMASSALFAVAVAAIHPRLAHCCAMSISMGQGENRPRARPNMRHKKPDCGNHRVGKGFATDLGAQVLGGFAGFVQNEEPAKKVSTSGTAASGISDSQKCTLHVPSAKPRKVAGSPADEYAQADLGLFSRYAKHGALCQYPGSLRNLLDAIMRSALIGDMPG